MLQTFAFKIRIFIWKYSCILKYQSLESDVESLPKDLDIMLRYAFENGTDIDFLCSVLMSWDQNQVILLPYHISSQKRHKEKKGGRKKNENPFAKIQP